MENVGLIIDKVTPLFDKVALAIGQGAQFSWGIVVKQQFLVGVQYAIQSICALALAIAVWIIAWILIKKGTEESKKKYERYGYTHNGDLVGWYMVATMAIICTIPLLFAFVDNSGEAVKHIINPEFYAVDYIIGLVK